MNTGRIPLNVGVLAKSLGQLLSHLWQQRSEERRVGKECRSRCDWSSDVCSSDLVSALRVLGDEHWKDSPERWCPREKPGPAAQPPLATEIGRASCRERV